MSDFWGKKLDNATKHGRDSEVSFLLRDHPDINVNWANPDFHQWTVLHNASFYSHVEVIKLLLTHPSINVNLKNNFGQTALSCGCEYGQVSVVRLLLKDPRVNVTLDHEGRTPLWHASCYGHQEVTEWLIASERDLGDVKNKKGKDWNHEHYTVLEIARKRNKTEVASLLERFLVNPAHTRHELRVKLGVLEALAAEVFALTVFLCDDLLQLNSSQPLTLLLLLDSLSLPPSYLWSCR